MKALVFLVVETLEILMLVDMVLVMLEAWVVLDSDMVEEMVLEEVVLAVFRAEKVALVVVLAVWEVFLVEEAVLVVTLAEEVVLAVFRVWEVSLVATLEVVVAEEVEVVEGVEVMGVDSQVFGLNHAFAFIKPCRLRSLGMENDALLLLHVTECKDT